MDYTNLLSVDAEGKTTLNEKELRKLLQVEGDKRVTEATPTIKSNAEKELRDSIRKEIEQEAKLSAEEKVQKTLEKGLNDLNEQKLAFSKQQVVSMFEAEKIDKADYEPFLDFVSGDAEKSVELAKSHISSIKKIAEKQYQDKIKENMGTNSEPPKSGSDSNGITKKPIITAF